MMRPTLCLLPLLGAALLFSSCQREDEDSGVPPSEGGYEVDDSPRWAEGDINAYDSAGITRLTDYSWALRQHLYDLEEAQRDEDEDMAAFYRELIAPLKEHIRELLRKGADPWARSLDEKGMLAPCARSLWPQDFVDELRREGFTSITDTPAPQ